MQRGTDPSPSEIFDAAVHSAREDELNAMGLEVVAGPGMATPTGVKPGVFAVRRALGDGRLAVLFPVQRMVEGRASLEAAGVVCEGHGDGVFVQVDDGPSGSRALRIAGPEGVMVRDTVLLRPRPIVPARPYHEPAREPEPAEDEPSPLAMLLAAVYAMRRRRRPPLREEYVRSLLEPSAGTPPLRDELQRAAADLERRLAALPAGPTRAAALQSLLDELAGGLLVAAERLFILDPQRSTLELLDPTERDRYLGFAWHGDDFPRGPLGPNEDRADQMFTALTRLRPERRANRGAAAAVREEEFDDAMQTRVRAGLVSVPGERGQRLHRDAAAAYQQMRTAAAAEGVTLAIRRSYRPRERAQAAAARADNPAAVAPFSSHTLGLAVDLKMSHGTLRFTETTTHPFQNLVDMYKSPVHKWMFLRGEARGWFPYRREPWHWEYNPPGFRDRLRQAQGPVPPAAAPRAAEDTNDPIVPPRTPVSITDSAGGAVPDPTPAELAAVAAARSAVRQSVSRGLTMTGPVGATARGNAPDDVRAVQRRLVDLGKLSASHAESPPTGTTGSVPQASLRASIAALRAFQVDVQFWVSRGTLTGVITPGVAEPGDATTALLDRVSVYSMGAGPTAISFRDHVVSRVTRSEAGVMFRGTALPSAIPAADYQAQGLTAGQAAALKFVSNQEGNFDAINTYDRALVSVGFIQFAGSRGLPPYLALLKTRQPAKFRDLLQKLGIDVEFTVSGGSPGRRLPAINASRVVVLDPAGPRVLRGADAETAIRDDKRLTTALILSGRDRDVQLVQIQAAVRNYVRPALDATVSWAAGPARARLGDLLRSQKGMAALFDRAIQEGLGAARRRFERVIQRLVRGAAPNAVAPTLADLQRREGDVLAELERDLQAATDVAALIKKARDALATVIQAARAAGATVVGLLARPELSTARRAVTDARSGLAAVINVTSPMNVPVDTTLGTMNTTLKSEESRLALTPSPPSLDALITALTASRQALATAAGLLSTSPMFLVRVQGIRRSTLDSSLAEVA